MRRDRRRRIGKGMVVGMLTAGLLVLVIGGLLYYYDYMSPYIIPLMVGAIGTELLGTALGGCLGYYNPCNWLREPISNPERYQRLLNTTVPMPVVSAAPAPSSGMLAVQPTQPSEVTQLSQPTQQVVELTALQTKFGNVLNDVREPLPNDQVPRSETNSPKLITYTSQNNSSSSTLISDSSVQPLSETTDGQSAKIS